MNDLKPFPFKPSGTFRPVVIAAGIGTQTVTDDFNRANQSPMAGNWSQDAAARFNLVSNQVVITALPDDLWAYYNAWTNGDDQYSQISVTTTGSGAGTGPAVTVRKATGATATYYRLALNDAGGFELGKIIAGAFTSLRTGSVTYIAGQLLGLSVKGTTLKIWYNGSQVGTDVTDAAISTGFPGLAYSSISTAVTLDDWSAGTT